MAPNVSIGGVAVPLPRFLGSQNWTSVATGSVGSADTVVDDPDGIYDFLELSQVVAEEPDSAPLSRTFTGYAYNITTSRGPHSIAAGRIHTMTIGDLNFLLHLQPLYGAAAKRPRESGSARLAWLMSTPGMAGIVFDNGLITPNTAMFGEEDLRGHYHDEVLQSICVAGIGSRIFYLTWVETAALGEEVTLFYAEPASILMSSTLEISNVLASIDDTTVFAPQMDSELEAQGEEIYCGLWLTYGGRGDRLFTHNDATHAAYFVSTSPPGLHRIGTLTLDRVGELDTAQHHSDVWLNVHSGALKTLSYTLRLPSSKVNFINAGMLLPNELTHLMGFETPGAVARVNERTVSLTPDTNKLYDLTLKLSLNGVPIIGGGGGGLPHVPICTPALMAVVQLVQGGATTVVTAPGTVGNTWLWLVAGRVNGVFVPPTGTWTQREHQACNQNVADDYPIRAYTKPVEAGDPTTWSIVGPKTTDSKYWMLEVPGEFDVAVGASPGANSDALVSITPTAGKVALLISFADLSTDDATYSLAPTAGMTEVADSPPLAPIVGINTRIVAATSGSYVVGSTWAHNIFANVAVIGLAFICTATENPPMRGQWIFDEIPTPTPDGTTTTFATLFPFDDTSLLVKVDRLDQTGAVTSVDGGAGTFTLGFAPAVGELVEVTYMGR